MCGDTFDYCVGEEGTTGIYCVWKPQMLLNILQTQDILPRPSQPPPTPTNQE